MNSTNNTRNIIAVAGASPIQNLRYPGSGNEGSCQEVYIHGGAQQLAEYLKDEHNVHGPPTEQASTNNDKVAYFVELQAVNPSSCTPSYRVKTMSSSPNTSRLQLPPNWAHIKENLKVVIFEDSASEFSNPGDIKKIVKSAPQLFIYKMTGGNGHLAEVSQWTKVRKSSLEPGGALAGRLIVIVDAEDLRAAGIELSRHLSWEKTVEDFFMHLATNGQFVSLLNCAHLIVLFNCDGVIHFRGSQPSGAKIYFTTEFAEGEYIQYCSRNTGYDTAETTMIGMSTAFTAGFASALAKNELGKAENIEAAVDDSIKQGILCARRLARFGFCSASENPRIPKYPLQIMKEDVKDKMPRDVPIPIEVITNSIHDRSNNDRSNNDRSNNDNSNWEENTTSESDDQPWSFLKHITGEPAEVAHLIVKDGPSEVLSRVPYASFGELMTADRKEIEGFRAITNLVSEYVKPRTSFRRPLSIGVFGPPGAGKSFSLVQVVKGVLKTDPERLEYNLSQFKDYSDLISAFHSVQASTISGKLPLVLFDEFDSNFGDQQLGWLRYFLAPMQDGQFTDRGGVYPLGKAIFVFLGGTSSTFKEFEKTAEREHGISAKGPDFVSRLCGYVDIRGPDPDPTSLKDHMYPIRRAMLLRALLKKYPGLNEGPKINIDDSLLHGLLTVPKFRHNARSIEQILAMSTLSEGTRFLLSDLPSQNQLNLHVDSEEFLECVRRRELPKYIKKKKVAMKLHTQHKEVLESHRENDKEIEVAWEQVKASWKDLSDDYKQSYMRQADDIPYKLRTIKYYIARTTVYGRQHITSIPDDKRTDLAKLEHERFISQQLQKKSLREEEKVLPNLIPWDDLTETWQKVYQDYIARIPAVMDECKHPVYDLHENGVQVLPQPLGV